MDLRERSSNTRQAVRQNDSGYLHSIASASPAPARSEVGSPLVPPRRHCRPGTGIRPAAQTIIQKLRALHDPPDEIEVEFGLKLNAQVGAFIAAAGTEANYKVTLTWKREEKKG